MGTGEGKSGEKVGYLIDSAALDIVESLAWFQRAVDRFLAADGRAKGFEWLSKCLDRVVLGGTVGTTFGRSGQVDRLLDALRILWRPMDRDPGKICRSAISDSRIREVVGLHALHRACILEPQFNPAA
jgi:hypothetical protein